MLLTVTSIEMFGNDKKKSAVYLNNEFAFALYKKEISEYKLDEGVCIEEELLNRIMSEKLLPRAKKRGMYLLQSMDRTESDMRRKLLDGGYPEEAIDGAIEYLKSFRYIDDYRYSCDYIHFKSASMSKKQIYNKLLAKGIAKDTIEQALCEFHETNECQEDELILQLMHKRCKAGLTELSYEERQKLFAYLYNKGFSISDIERVYNENCLT